MTGAFAPGSERLYGSDHFCEKVCDGKGILKKTADEGTEKSYSEAERFLR